MKVLGLLLLALTIAFTSDAQTEIKKEYYSNGKIKSETPYVDGKINGVQKKYFKNGILESEDPILNGQTNGTYKWYFESGMLRVEVDYVNGKRNGMQRYYYKSGNIEMETIFKEGEIVSSKTFNDVFTVTKTEVAKADTLFIKYNSDSCVSGNCKNGFGTMVYKSGDTYTGNFEKGIRQGKGKYTWRDGTVYDGEFADNFMSGFSEIVWPNKDKYSGDFKAGLRTGKGKYYYANGTIYEGDFKDNIFEGKGTMLYNDGSKYIGDWKSDKRNGKGRMELKNNYVYEGDFVNNLMDGTGTMEWVEGNEFKGNKYIGEYKNGHRNGKGKYIYANGTILEGDFENDKFIDPRAANLKVNTEKDWEKDGYKIIYTDGNYYGTFTGKARIYKAVTYYSTMSWGQFQNAVLESRRVLLAYEGDLVNGIKEGVGKEDEKVTTKDGIVYHVWYIGEFKNGLRNGQGRMESRTKVYDVGTYEDGVFIGR